MARKETNDTGGALVIGFSMVIGYLGLGHFFRHLAFVIDSAFGLRYSSFDVICSTALYHKPWACDIVSTAQLGYNPAYD